MAKYFSVLLTTNTLLVVKRQLGALHKQTSTTSNDTMGGGVLASASHAWLRTSMGCNLKLWLASLATLTEHTVIKLLERPYYG